jgi:hypothetical protein
VIRCHPQVILLPPQALHLAIVQILLEAADNDLFKPAPAEQGLLPILELVAQTGVFLGGKIGD